MMAAAARAASEESARAGKSRPLLLGVTVLTSLKEEDLRRIGIENRWPTRSSDWRLWPKTQASTESSAPPRDRDGQKRMRARISGCHSGIRPAWRRPRIRSVS